LCRAYTLDGLVQNVGKTTPNETDPPELECPLWVSTLMVLVTGASNEEQERFIMTSSDCTSVRLGQRVEFTIVTKHVARTHTPPTGTVHLKRDISSKLDRITHQASNSGGFENCRIVEDMRTSESVTLDYGCDWRSGVQVWDESVC